jgi:hypothetical protein
VRFSDLSSRVRAAQLPVVVFKATVAETGQRLLMAPVRSPPPPSDADSVAGAVEWLHEFPEADPRLATAVRLSATFPYVSPAARAAADPVRSQSPLAQYHIVDGGYADNEGAVTSVDWINRLIAYYSRDERILSRPFDDVLLIRIQPFPAERPPTNQRLSAISGWRAALLGPLDAMMNVRGASQTERGDLEIGLLTQATRAAIEAMRQRYAAEAKAAQAVLDALQPAQPLDSGSGSADAVRQQLEQHDRRRTFELLQRLAEEKETRLDAVRIHTVTIDFHPTEDVRIPLSWKLTHRQKQNLDAAWQKIVAGLHPHRPLEKLDALFLRIAPPDASSPLTRN